MQFGIQIVVRMLLSVGLLLNGFCTRAIHHAHAGGDRPHDHHVSHEHDHRGHSHDVCSNHTSRASELSDSIPHRHFSMLGFEMTTPSSGESNQSDPSPYEPTKLAVIAATRAGSLAAAWRAPVSPLRALQCAANAMRAQCPAASCRFSFRPALAGFLCDTARHERSGVQLA